MIFVEETTATAPSHLAQTLAWLVRLRWVTVIGQTVMVAVAHWVFALVMPMEWVFGLIGLTAGSNLYLMRRGRDEGGVNRGLIVQVLLLDTGTLTALLACSGGVHNPFASFYLVHVAMAAVALGSFAAWGMAVVATLGYGSLFVLAGPHAHHAISESLHLRGMFCATALTAGCIAYFAGRLNRELRERERELGELRLVREQNERFAALATLAGGVAHELGTPLGTIAIAAHELERSIVQSGSDTWQEDARLIRAEVERCRAILGRLNARSTNELGEAPGTFPLTELLAAVRGELAESQLERLKVASADDALLFLPKAAVAEALRSLVRNAFDASPPDAHVEMRATVEGPHIVFVVRDAGSGLSTDAAIHATAPFFTTKEPGNGMGLGLYLVRLLAERLGGNFALRANADAGATAELCLPKDARAAR